MSDISEKDIKSLIEKENFVWDGAWDIRMKCIEGPQTHSSINGYSVITMQVHKVNGQYSF